MLHLVPQAQMLCTCPTLPAGAAPMFAPPGVTPGVRPGSFPGAPVGGPPPAHYPPGGSSALPPGPAPPFAGPPSARAGGTVLNQGPPSIPGGMRPPTEQLQRMGLAGTVAGAGGAPLPVRTLHTHNHCVTWFAIANNSAWADSLLQQQPTRSPSHDCCWSSCCQQAILILIPHAGWPSAYASSWVAARVRHRNATSACTAHERRWCDSRAPSTAPAWWCRFRSAWPCTPLQHSNSSSGWSSPRQSTRHRTPSRINR